MKKNPKGNILVIVLFIMIVSSLLGLLASQYVTTLTTLTWLFKNYYTAYYYGYGGIELALAQVRIHGYGFEASHSLAYPSTCKWINCGAATTITARSTYIWAAAFGTASTWCATSMLPLKEGESLIVPLFRDESVGFDESVYHIMSVEEFMQQTPIVYSEWPQGQEVSVRIIDEEVTFYATVAQGQVGVPMSLAEQEDLRVTQDSITNKKYLIISNPASGQVGVCIWLDTPTVRLPLPVVTISSKGMFGTTQVSLWASKVVQLPSYLVFGTISN